MMTLKLLPLVFLLTQIGIFSLLLNMLLIIVGLLGNENLLPAAHGCSRPDELLLAVAYDLGDGNFFLGIQIEVLVQLEAHVAPAVA
jgi:hypothetical protein